MRIQIGEWVLEVTRGDQSLAHLLSDAGLLETFGNLKGRTDEDGELLVVRAGRRKHLALAVVQRFKSHGGVFGPGLLLIPETATLFLGAGTRLLAYDLNGPARLWEDMAEHGFLAWDRVGNVVLMSAELELAAWTTRGHKLWATHVEPPWSYTLEADQLELDVMGRLTRFPVLAGPRKDSP